MTDKQIIERKGRNVEIVPLTKVETSIQAAREIFAQCYFDQTRAKRLIHCLKRYRRSINTATQEPMGPLHDEFSHGADAFRMLGLVSKYMSNNDPMKPLTYDTRGIV